MQLLTLLSIPFWTCAALSPITLAWVVVCLLSPRQRWAGLYTLLAGIVGAIGLLTLGACFYVLAFEGNSDAPDPGQYFALSCAAGFGFSSAMAAGRFAYEWYVNRAKAR
jgi:hypothetical protein